MRGKQVNIYLQRFQANEARDGEAVNDVFLAGHRLSLSPSRRPVSSKTGPTFSIAGTQDAVGPTSLPIRARGHGRGPLLCQVHSPPPPLPIALRTGPSALPESSASARALHTQTSPFFNSGENKGTLFESESGFGHRTADKHNHTGPRRSPVKMALMEPVAIIYRPLTTVYWHQCRSFGGI